MFIYFTEEQKQRANAVDLENFLLRHNEKLLRSGREKRLASDHSVTIRGNEWYDHASREGGLAIDFIKRYYNLGFPEAMSLLLGEEGEPCHTSERKPEPEKPFQLPEASQDMRRVFAYLTKTRLLDREIVSDFMKKKLIYEDAQFHNAVFVGVDAEGTARHAHKRGTCTRGKPFKGNVDGSDPRYSFHYVGQSDTVYVFEAPVDMLSFLTLYPENWKQHSYVCLCGVAEHALLQLLKENLTIQKAVLCLDHDAAGIEASGRLEEILREQSSAEVFFLQSRFKDWNEDLKAMRGKEVLPAEEHPQLLLCAEFCRSLLEGEEKNGPAGVQNLSDRRLQAEWLKPCRDLPAPDLREEITGWCRDMVLQCLKQEQKELRQAGLPVPDKAQ